ncbi:hypothetical protein E2G73_09095 [Salmonella enterica subsp. enterica serovar Stanley]|nr:hypothetical protein [Salmonella enterica subsp. enterica serovar Stanley]ECB6176417.1 hypothetical protein [Salmonella enterica subsp. enterica serovar Stanley]ECF2930169.1 hypothetical protein [Salmonella enterica subsp. enterica serovar Stanley]EDY0797964.1 hypothetical protein [Salmonella enterica subsp. enterica serovar Oslo]
MTTITREQQKQILIDTANHVISRDNTSPYSENLRELARIALASLEAEPVAYIFKHPAGELFWSLTDESNKGQNDVMPVYAAQPVQETGVYKDMLNIIGLLEKNEWAEHCTSTVLGSLLESEITRLVSKEQPASVVPEEHYQRLSELYHAQEKRLFKIAQRIKGPAFDKYSHSPSQAIDVLESALFGENEATCRAAMLQGSQPVSNRDELSSPVIPDGYALVPIVPTEDMVINGFESEPDPHFSDEKVWAEYKALSGCRRAARRAELCWAAMIKAAPKQEGNNG